MSERPDLFYRIAHAALRDTIRFLLGGVSITGKENVPTDGPFIIAANHRAHVDPTYLALITKRPLCFMGKEELFKVPVFGNMIRRLGAFPIKRGTADRAALRRAVDLLKAGRGVVIFPEGTRSENTALGPAEKGFALIARQSGAPIVPVALEGTEKVLPKGSVFLRRGFVRVSIGKPLTVSEILEGATEKSETLVLIGQATMAAIQELLTQTEAEKKESKNLSLTP